MKEKTNTHRKMGAKGITLIALIVTIIVMLILVAVTISVALNGGLIGKAQEAKAGTQEAQIQERDLLTGRIKIGDTWYDSLDKYLEGKPSDNQGSETSSWEQDEDGNITFNGEDSGIKIGDYVEYTPDSGTYESTKLAKEYTGTDSNSSNLTTEDLNWRILGVDNNGCLILISELPTTKKVYFKEAVAYNNGVYILNDICAKLYGNSKLGATARSLTIEDVEAGFNDAGISTRNEYADGGVRYGETKKYTTNLNYPVLYAEENGSGIDVEAVKTNGIEGSEPYYTEEQLTTREKESDSAKTNLTCKQTAYVLDTSKGEYFKNESFKNIIFSSDDSLGFWLASRCIDAESIASDEAYFALRCVDGSTLSSAGVFMSCGQFHAGHSSHGGGAGGGVLDPGSYNPSVSEISLGDGIMPIFIADTDRSNTLRPVIRLSSGVKVTASSSENSADNPHTLN